jgi:hypothetical protein
MQPRSTRPLTARGWHDRTDFRNDKLSSELALQPIAGAVQRALDRSSRDPSQAHEHLCIASLLIQLLDMATVAQRA